MHKKQILKLVSLCFVISGFLSGLLSYFTWADSSTDVIHNAVGGAIGGTIAYYTTFIMYHKKKNRSNK